MSAHGQLGPGMTISGHYRIVRLLSEGGMGAVFVAEHVTTRKQRALKIMRGELLGDPSLRDRFVQEAQIGGRIESEHVVEVVDAGFDDQLRVPWIAMELLEGESLADRVSRGPIAAAEVAAIFQQMCHGLAAAHRVGIVHRDLKPENVFIARARRVGIPFTVKVLDLGIAKVVAEAKATRMATAAIGTPLWMAPEQTELSNRIGPATDVWALGLIAFRMLTGRYYWHEAYRNANNVTAILTEMLVTPIVPASQRAQELGAHGLLPNGFDAWFARCVDRDPTRRFADAGQAFEALSPVLSPPAMTTAPAQHGSWSGTQVYPQQPQMGGTMVYPTEAHAGVPYGHTPQPPLMSPAFGVPQAQTPPHLAQQGTPPGVQMGTAPPRTPTKKSSGLVSFLVGLGSVAIVGVIAVVIIKKNDEPQPTKNDEKTKPAAAPTVSNKWVKVKGVKAGVTLGVDKDSVSPLVRGFRPARKIAPPFAAFEMQQHEVTWAELDEFLDGDKGKKLIKPKDGPSEKDKREKLPAVGVAWQTASAYCKSLGGNLPTEEQWELAARGRELRKFAWGDEGIDLHGTRVFVGKKASTLPVMTSEQDKTPGDEPIYDLMGNAQEWTLDVYRDDFAEQDEGWAQAGGVTFRAVRGLPLGLPPEPALMSGMSAAFREPVCATGACAPGGSKGTDESTVLFRTAFSTAPPVEGGPGARTQLTKTLSEAKTELSTCADKSTDDRGYLLKVDFSRPLKKVPLCRASDGYDDPMECCTGKVCDHAPHHIIKYDPAKATVSIPSDAPIQESSASTCAKAALEKKLGIVKWPEVDDEWAATIWVLRASQKEPESLPYIGFRCVRQVQKEDKD